MGFPQVPPISPGPLAAVTAVLLNCSGKEGREESDTEDSTKPSPEPAILLCNGKKEMHLQYTSCRLLETSKANTNHSHAKRYPECTQDNLYLAYTDMEMLSFVADIDLRGRNVLQITSLSLLRELLTLPQEQVFLPQHELLPHHR